MATQFRTLIVQERDGTESRIQVPIVTSQITDPSSLSNSGFVDDQTSPQFREVVITEGDGSTTTVLVPIALVESSTVVTQEGIASITPLSSISPQVPHTPITRIVEVKEGTKEISQIAVELNAITVPVAKIAPALLSRTGDTVLERQLARIDEGETTQIVAGVSKPVKVAQAIIDKAVKEAASVSQFFEVTGAPPKISKEERLVNSANEAITLLRADSGSFEASQIVTELVQAGRSDLASAVFTLTKDSASEQALIQTIPEEIKAAAIELNFSDRAAIVLLQTPDDLLTVSQQVSKTSLKNKAFALGMDLEKSNPLALDLVNDEVVQATLGSLGKEIGLSLIPIYGTFREAKRLVENWDSLSTGERISGTGLTLLSAVGDVTIVMGPVSALTKLAFKGDDLGRIVIKATTDSADETVKIVTQVSKVQKIAPNIEVVASDNLKYLADVAKLSEKIEDGSQVFEIAIQPTARGIRNSGIVDDVLKGRPEALEAIGRSIDDVPFRPRNTQGVIEITEPLSDSQLLTLADALRLDTEINSIIVRGIESALPPGSAVERLVSDRMLLWGIQNTRLAGAELNVAREAAELLIRKEVTAQISEGRTIARTVERMQEILDPKRSRSLQKLRRQAGGAIAIGKERDVAGDLIKAQDELAGLRVKLESEIRKIDVDAPVKSFDDLLKGRKSASADKVGSDITKLETFIQDLKNLPTPRTGGRPRVIETITQIDKGVPLESARVTKLKDELFELVDTLSSVRAKRVAPFKVVDTPEILSLQTRIAGLQDEVVEVIRKGADNFGPEVTKLSDEINTLQAQVVKARNLLRLRDPKVLSKARVLKLEDEIAAIEKELFDETLTLSRKQVLKRKLGPLKEQLEKAKQGITTEEENLLFKINKLEDRIEVVKKSASQTKNAAKIARLKDDLDSLVTKLGTISDDIPVFSARGDEIGHPLVTILQTEKQVSSRITKLEVKIAKLRAADEATVVETRSVRFEPETKVSGGGPGGSGVGGSVDYDPSGGGVAVLTQAEIVVAASPVARSEIATFLRATSSPGAIISRPKGVFALAGIPQELPGILTEEQIVPEIGTVIPALPEPETAPEFAPTRAPDLEPAFAPDLEPARAPDLEPALAPVEIPETIPGVTPIRQPGEEPGKEPGEVPIEEPAKVPVPGEQPSSLTGEEPAEEPSISGQPEPEEEGAPQPTKTKVVTEDLVRLIKQRDRRIHPRIRLDVESPKGKIGQVRKLKLTSGYTWLQARVYVTVFAPYREKDIKYTTIRPKGTVMVRGPIQAWDSIQRDGFTIGVNSLDEWAEWFTAAPETGRITEIKNEVTRKAGDITLVDVPRPELKESRMTTPQDEFAEFEEIQPVLPIEPVQPGTQPIRPVTRRRPTRIEVEVVPVTPRRAILPAGAAAGALGVRRRLLRVRQGGFSWPMGNIYIGIYPPFTEDDIVYDITPPQGTTSTRGPKEAWNRIKKIGFEPDASTYDEWAAWFTARGEATGIEGAVLGNIGSALDPQEGGLKAFEPSVDAFFNPKNVDF
ncbi:hypothetical protein LCGC14_0381710 [marine sediment metagenome]|uniref:Uncharacterized protein n=1 Tax=marine sediment metagenome TaxID=412755 RepID=A0A0F9T833_9ZZZZ